MARRADPPWTSDLDLSPRELLRILAGGAVLVVIAWGLMSLIALAPA